MKKWIIFDVDDVLVNFRQSMSNACKTINKDVHWTKWTSYKHAEIYGFSSSAHVKTFMQEAEVLENAKVEPGVRNVLQLLRDRGYSIGLITARGWHPRGEIITSNMVKDNELAVDKIILSHAHTDKKSEFINQFDGEIVAFLDDSPKHVMDFIEHGVTSYLMHRPWNVDDIDLPRVNTILQFLDCVIKKETSNILND